MTLVGVERPVLLVVGWQLTRFAVAGQLFFS
jgi:hypothetical protein